MKQALDFLGRPIKEGDTLVYPVRHHSTMVLKKMIVRCVSPPRLDGDELVTPVIGENDRGQRVTIIRTERSVIVEV